MNNKLLGTQFEHEVCDKLKRAGWWTHFLSPDKRGAQPFDIIAVKDGVAVAIDCKTSASPIFTIDRLEDNQELAFEMWRLCGNSEPFLLVKYEGEIYRVLWIELSERRKVDLRRCGKWMA